MAKQHQTNAQTDSARKRRVRGKVLPPKLRQSTAYWDELSERCLQAHEREAELEPTLSEPQNAESSALR